MKMVTQFIGVDRYLSDFSRLTSDTTDNTVARGLYGKWDSPLWLTFEALIVEIFNH